MSRLVTLPPPSTPRADGLLPGGWWHETEEDGRIVCDLCPRACALRPGDRGFCFVRQNLGGEMFLTTYGRSTGFCIDPIEKKPLNQFYPGTSVLSFGTAGCNLGCKFCQNWSISKSREVEQLSELASPDAIAEAALRLGSRSVAFTYNDPVIWAEYAIDTAKACRARGIQTVAVTAGYITREAFGPFYEVMDAANVDLKGFTEEFYRHLTLSHLEPVLDTLRWLQRETNVWFEITNLIIPEENDSRDELKQMCEWILRDLGPDVPVHFTAFHPDFRLRHRPNTPPETLLAAYDIATSLGLNYVYVGNILAPRQQSTYCPGCKQLVIERRGYDIGRFAIRGGKCDACGTPIAGRFDDAPEHWGSRRLPVRIAEFQRNVPPPPPSPTSLPILSSPRMDSRVTTPDILTADSLELTAPQEQAILRAAAESLAAATLGRAAQIADPTLAGVADAPVLGTFVTVKRRGRLRGCCGTIGRIMPLAESLAHSAARTADDDPRFPPVSPHELPYLDLDVWLLSNRQPMTERGPDRAAGVIVGKHGLTIQRGAASGLLLPGVAIEHGLTAEQFLRQVALKAGLPATAWQDEDVVLTTFEGQELTAPLSALLPAAPELPAPRFTAADARGIADFSAGNVAAALTGATPMFYAPEVADGNVHGVVLSLHGPAGDEWLTAKSVSLRQTMPLQATCSSLAAQIGQALTQLLNNVQQLEGAALRVAILGDPALHGTVAEADLRGFDPATRALVVAEGPRTAVCFDPQLTPETALEQAATAAGVRNRGAAEVYSFAAASNTERLLVSDAPKPQPGPQIRQAAQAGRFYPAEAIELAKLVEECLPEGRRHQAAKSVEAPAAPPEEPKKKRRGKQDSAAKNETPTWKRCPAVMVPHAGLVFSGRIAGQVFGQVEIPERVVILSPKHTPHGVDWSVAPHDAWAIPGGQLAADPELAKALAAEIPGLELDASAHVAEHGIEVELPFLARLAPQTKVTGIALGNASLAECHTIASGLAKVLGPDRERTLLVISSDMNHFAPDDATRRLDEIALAAFERLDPDELFRIVREHQISMCGLIPAVIVLATLRHWGQLDRCERASYATSADTTGDKSRVVGYAGMLVG